MNNRWKVAACAAISATALLSIGLVGAGVASAHDTIISGTAACQNDGTFTITWKLENDYTLVETVLSGSSTGGGTLPAFPWTIARRANNAAPNTFITVDETGVPGSATRARLSVHVRWSDGFTADRSGSVNLPVPCTPAPPAPTVVAPVPPTVVTTTDCGVPDSFTAGPTAGIVYTPPSGTINEGQTVTVVATAEPGYALDTAVPSSFTLTGGPIEPCVTTTTSAPTTTATPTTAAGGSTGTSDTVAVTTTTPTTIAVGPPTSTANETATTTPVPATTSTVVNAVDLTTPSVPVFGLPETGAKTTVEVVLAGFALLAGVGLVSVARRRSATAPR
jgi:LPXTG-motif cell wall-anchored protein